MARPDEHPDPDRLARFAAGLLDDATSAAAVEGHLAACEACRQVVEGLPLDPLSRRLHQAYQAGLHEGMDHGLDPARPPAELADHTRYQVESFLGAGGMGVVYKARHKLMQRSVALKVVRRHLLARPGAVERFVSEVRAAAQLSHPNIVAAFDADQAGDLHFLVTEYVEGLDLARHVQERGPLRVAQACDYARQAALGLQHAHERGLTHRDVKPHNLLLTPTGQIKVLDFGLARFVAETVAKETVAPGEAVSAPPSATATGIVLGSVDFVAPEQVAEPRTADARADIYSLGCTLYFLLAGRPPFPDGSVEEKLAAHCCVMPTSLTELRADVPEALNQVVARMMAKEAGQRYQTAAEVVVALVPFIPQASRPLLQRSRSVQSLVVVSLLGLIGLLTFARLDNRNGERPVTLRKSLNQPAPNALAVVEKAFVVKFDSSDPVIRGEHRVFKGHTERVVGVAFSPDGRSVVSADGAGQLRRWDLMGDRNEVFDAASPKQTLSAAFACGTAKGSGQWALLGGRDVTCQLSDATGGKLLGRLREGGERKPGEPERRPVNALAISPDGRRALTESERGGVCVWDVATRQECGHLDSLGYYAQAISVSPDGRSAVFSTNNGAVHVCDLDTGNERFHFQGLPSNAVSLAISPDSRQLLGGLGNGEVVLWNLEERQEVRRFRKGHQFVVIGVAFLPDGKRFLSGSSADRVVCLWDIESGKQLQRFGIGATSPLAVSADGCLAACGHWENTVVVWRLPP